MCEEIQLSGFPPYIFCLFFCVTIMNLRALSPITSVICRDRAWLFPTNHCVPFHGTVMGSGVGCIPISTLLPKWLRGKESACNAGDMRLILGCEDTLEKGVATHTSVLAWEIPWTEEPGWLQSTESQRVRHNLATELAHTIWDICCGFREERLLPNTTRASSGALLPSQTVCGETVTPRKQRTGREKSQILAIWFENLDQALTSTIWSISGLFSYMSPNFSFFKSVWIKFYVVCYIKNTWYKHFRTQKLIHEHKNNKNTPQSKTLTLLALRKPVKNKAGSFVETWMDLVCHTEWRKTERDKQILYINTYMWDLEKWYGWTYLNQGRKRTDAENRHVDICWGGRGG